MSFVSLLSNLVPIRFVVHPHQGRQKNKKKRKSKWGDVRTTDFLISQFFWVSSWNRLLVFKLLETRSAKFWQCFFFAKNTLAIHYPKTKHQTVNYCQTQFSTWKDKTFVSYLVKKLHKFSKQYYSRNEINLRNGRTWWRWTFWDFSFLGMFLDFFFWRFVSRVKDGLKVYLQKLCSLFSLVDHIFPSKNYLIGISIDSQWMLLLFGTVNHSFQYFFPWSFI